MNRMIYCPACHRLHIDEPARQEPHMNHTCHHCGETFVVGCRPCVGVDIEGLSEEPRNREAQRRLARGIGIAFEPYNRNCPEAGGEISFLEHGMTLEQFKEAGITKAQLMAFASGKRLASAAILFRILRAANIRKLRFVRKKA
jgi:hypothetical protein